MHMCATSHREETEGQNREVNANGRGRERGKKAWGGGGLPRVCAFFLPQSAGALLSLLRVLILLVTGSRGREWACGLEQQETEGTVSPACCPAKLSLSLSSPPQVGQHNDGGGTARKKEFLGA